MHTFKIVYYQNSKPADIGINIGEYLAVTEAAALNAIKQGYDAIQITDLTTLPLGPRFHYQSGPCDPREVLGFCHEQELRNHPLMSFGDH